MSVQNFEMFAGDTKSLNCTVTDAATGAAKNITGATIEWVLYNERTELNVLTKSTASGITITNGLAGQFTVALIPADTSALGIQSYYHEAEVTDAGGNVSTVFTGYITILVSRT